MWGDSGYETFVNHKELFKADCQVPSRMGGIKHDSRVECVLQGVCCTPIDDKVEALRAAAS